MTSPLETVLGAAESALGVPYTWGGNSLASGVDCSGFVQQAFRAAGINLPRVSNDQANTGTAVGSLAEAQPGDLLAWDNGPRNVGADHVAIYLGNGLMIEASRTGEPVKVSKVHGTPTIRRIIGSVPSTGAQQVTLGPNTDRSVTTYSIAAFDGGTAEPPAAVTNATTDPSDRQGGLGDDLPPNATPEQTEEYIQQHFPTLAAFMGDNAIHMLLVAAANEKWSDAKLEQAVHQTDYWKTHGLESRQFDVFLAENGVGSAEVANLIGRAKGVLSDLFGQNGVPITDGELGELAKQAIRHGDITLQGDVRHPDALNEIVAGRVTPDIGAGNVTANAETIKGWAKKDYLIPITDTQATMYATALLNGSMTEDGVKDALRQQAVERYPWLKDHLADGGTTRGATGGLQATIGDTLELDPETVDLLDPKYRGVLEMFDSKAGGYRSMTLGEAAQWARDQGAYLGTRQAKSNGAAFAEQFLQWSGRVA